MKRLKRTVVIATAAILQLAVCAYADEGILPSNNAFSGTSGATTLETTGGAKISCEKDTVSEGLFKLSASNGSATFSFTGCSILGLPINSLGDAKGTILIPEAQILTCLLSSAKLEFGIVIHMMKLGPMGETEPKPVHMEVPAIGSLLLMTGSALGRIIVPGKGKELTFSFKQKKGVQEQTKCTYENGMSAEYKLSLEENSKKSEALAIESEEKVSFTTEVTLMDK